MPAYLCPPCKVPLTKSRGVYPCPRKPIHLFAVDVVGDGDREILLLIGIRKGKCYRADEAESDEYDCR